MSTTGRAGLDLAPFRALRYDPVVAGDLASVTADPADIVRVGGPATLERSSDVNVVRLILPRPAPGRGDGGSLLTPSTQTQLSSTATAAAAAAAAAAVATLASWRAAGVLRADPVPGLYVYEQEAGPGRVQRGLLGGLEVTPPGDGVVLPHEDTSPGPVADRLALYEALGADLEPVLLVHDHPDGPASELVASVGDGAPLADLVDERGHRHRLWIETDPAVLQRVRDDLRGSRAMIADGHHRWAAYVQRQQDAHRAGRGHGPWDRGLVLLVNARHDGPVVRALPRVVAGIGAGDLGRRSTGVATVTDLEGNLEAGLVRLAAAGAGSFLLASGEELRLLSDVSPRQQPDHLPGGHLAAWAALDANVLQDALVETAWGLPGAAVTDAVDVADAVRRAAATGGTAVLLNPPAIGEITALAAAGERLPRKSTSFTPKPRVGLVLRAFVDAGESAAGESAAPDPSG